MSKVVQDPAGGDVPPEFLKQWESLPEEKQKKIQQYIKHLNLVDAGTVEVNTKASNVVNLTWKKQGPFAFLPSEVSNTVRKADSNKTKRDAQIEAILEGIEFIFRRTLPRGMVLNSEMVQAPVMKPEVVEGCTMMSEILGKGNSAGEITVFKDKSSGQDMALKTVMISQFNANEIRLWVKLGDSKQAPELYHFELKDNKLIFTMEIMTGKDLQGVIDENMWTFQDPELARDFSLCILHDLLEIWEEMRSKQFVHGDMHAGNLRLEKSMAVKIFDFGRAKNLLKEEENVKSRLVRNDIVGIIRVFCALYSGFDFNDIFEAIKVLEANNLKELDDCMIRISLENRKELYTIMSMLFDTVRKGTSSESLGDTTKVSSHVRDLISSDIRDIKKKAAVIIFPDRFRDKPECEPSLDVVDSDLDPIWNDPDMDLYVFNVSDADLRELEALR